MCFMRMKDIYMGFPSVASMTWSRVKLYSIILAESEFSETRLYVAVHFGLLVFPTPRSFMGLVVAA